MLIENVEYLSEKEWVSKGYIILHCQHSLISDENEVELFSDHQVKKKRYKND